MSGTPYLAVVKVRSSLVQVRMKLKLKLNDAAGRVRVRCGDRGGAEHCRGAAALCPRGRRRRVSASIACSCQPRACVRTVPQFAPQESHRDSSTKQHNIMIWNIPIWQDTDAFLSPPLLSFRCAAGGKSGSSKPHPLVQVPQMPLRV